MSRTDTREDTRERILETARALANDAGIEAVTIRSVAARLSLSPGNVSYHFARREDLVLALAETLTAQQETHWEGAATTCADLLERYRRALYNQYRHRGLALALPHLVETYPRLRASYADVERRRFRQQRQHLSSLHRHGAIDAGEHDRERLLAHLVLTARFWLAEYRTTFRSRSVETVVDHYLALMADLLHAYAAPGSVAELQPYRDRLLTLPS